MIISLRIFFLLFKDERIPEYFLSFENKGNILSLSNFNLGSLCKVNSSSCVTINHIINPNIIKNKIHVYIVDVFMELK